MTKPRKSTASEKLERLESEIPAMSRKQVEKLLVDSVACHNVEKLEVVLQTGRKSDETGNGLFRRPPKGTYTQGALDRALNKAATVDCAKAIPVLIQAGAKSAYNEHAAIRNAGFNNHKEVLRALVEAGGDIDEAILSVNTAKAGNRLRKFKSDMQKGFTDGDGESGWSAMSDSCIALTDGGDGAPRLTTVFNFRSKEVLTTVSLPEHETSGPPVIRSFDDFADKTLLREAAEKLAAAGGGKPLKFRV